ncbi:hypothetical protein ACKXF4_08345 [Faecalibacterium prausnitzii]|uniref:hypothetical protein n=1 Tax=Faecalibacterium prausnitzii TaxID=853 RepID=UPI003AAAAB8F
MKLVIGHGVAFKAAGAFGRDSEKEMHIRVIWRRYINGCCHWDAELLGTFLGLLLLTLGLTRTFQHHRFSMVITSNLL